jgi:hypothetical protein
MPPKTLKNFSIIKTHVVNALGERVLERIQSFFAQVFAENRWIRFDNDVPDNEIVILFLHFLVRYWPQREYGLFFSISIS